jgi:hypothetical protein
MINPPYYEQHGREFSGAGYTWRPSNEFGGFMQTRIVRCRSTQVNIIDFIEWRRGGSKKRFRSYAQCGRAASLHQADRQAKIFCDTFSQELPARCGSISTIPGHL